VNIFMRRHTYVCSHPDDDLLVGFTWPISLGVSTLCCQTHTHTHTHTLLYTEASGRKIVRENLSLQNMLSSICSKKNTCILHSSRLRLALWISLFPLLLSSLLHVHATRERTPHKYRVAKTHRMPYPIDHFPQISH